LRKGWGENRWKRVIRFRLGNEIKVIIGKTKKKGYAGCVEGGWRHRNMCGRDVETGGWMDGGS